MSPPLQVDEPAYLASLLFFNPPLVKSIVCQRTNCFAVANWIFMQIVSSLTASGSHFSKLNWFCFKLHWKKKRQAENEWKKCFLALSNKMMEINAGMNLKFNYLREGWIIRLFIIFFFWISLRSITLWAKLLRIYKIFFL